MKINDILSPYKYFEIAKKEDNDAILDFFHSMTMDTSQFSLRFDRGTNFFNFTKEQSDSVVVFVIKDEQNKIKGTASIAFIPHLLNGKEELCAYLGDLRISPNLSPKIRLQWKKCYTEIITNFKEIEEFKGVTKLYSAILDDNKAAIRSLLKNNDNLIYKELCPYKAFNILAPYPFSKYFISQFEIKELHLDEVITFIKKNIYFKGLELSPKSLEYRIKNWGNFDQHHFIGVFENQKLIAVTAPWICQTKKLVVTKMNWTQKILNLFFLFLKIPLIKENCPIKTLYLTHLIFEKNLAQDKIKSCLSSILFYLMNKRNHFHTISFFAYEEWNINDLPFLKEITSAHLYQVMNKSQNDNKDYINLENCPPNFEIGIA